ncbi:MAG: NAD(P)H-hydrate dehydratase [Candidatus Pacebacteria bacterium]|nr:NAD(P)H-hydrate dehydratase [Candidatus Paceibacterota bacterium]
MLTKVNKEILKRVYLPRPSDSHKYDFGLLLIIGGGEFYTGSPALSAMAAFRAGVDMAQILAPKRAADIIAGFSPNFAAFPLRGDWLDKEDVGVLISHAISAKSVAGEKTAIVIGGGVGRSEETQEAIGEFLEETDSKIVVDADAIYALSKNPLSIKDNPAIITPNAHEFFILTGKKVVDLAIEEKAKIVQEEAEKINSTILLKGFVDIISNGKEIIADETGTPFMTVGGTGDTLAGICGAFLAMGFDPFLAAQAGSFVNGKAGELAAKKFGAGMTAMDLIEEVVNVIKI